MRTRPGTGGLFRSSWDPILIASRGTPDAVDRSAVRNVIETDDVVYANYPAKRAHPYEKPPEVLGHILARVCRRGDVVLDPFAGSGSSRVAAEKLGLDLVLERLRYRPAVRGDVVVADRVVGDREHSGHRITTRSPVRANQQRRKPWQQAIPRSRSRAFWIYGAVSLSAWLARNADGASYRPTYEAHRQSG